VTRLSQSHRSSPPAAPRRALWVHAGALGDFVLALRVADALHQSGFAGVTILGRPGIAGMALGCYGIDEILDVECGGYHPLFSADPIPADHCLRRFIDRFDLIVDMLGATALTGRALSARPRAIIRIDPRPEEAGLGHVTDPWMKCLVDAGLTGSARAPRIAVSADARRRARARLVSVLPVQRASIILIHPGSGGAAKCWPIGRFVSLARELATRGHGVIFIIGDVERARWGLDRMAALRSAAPVIEPAGAVELRDALAAAELYVGNDSGASHLAAAVAAPTVAVFGPTDPRRWRPLGEHVTVVRRGAASWPSVDEVLEAAHRRLLALCP